MTVGAIARLELVEVERYRSPASGRALKARARYVERLAQPLRQLDFVIDGVSLLQRVLSVDLPEPYGLKGDEFVSVMDLTWPQDTASNLRWLLGRAERPAEWEVLERGRLPIYVCPICTEIDCGALTVAVERLVDPASGQEVVRWDQLRVDDARNSPIDMPDLSPVGMFTFAAAQFDVAVGAALVQVNQLMQAEEKAEREWKATHGLRAWMRRTLRRPT